MNSETGSKWMSTKNRLVIEFNHIRDCLLLMTIRIRHIHEKRICRSWEVTHWVYPTSQWRTGAPTRPGEALCPAKPARQEARPTGGMFLASPTSPALIGLTGSAKPVKHVDSRTPGRVAGA